METINSKLLNEANVLYLKSRTVDCNSIDPITWLYNQNKLRKSWEAFNKKSE